MTTSDFRELVRVAAIAELKSLSALNSVLK